MTNIQLVTASFASIALISIILILISSTLAVFIPKYRIREDSENNLFAVEQCDYLFLFEKFNFGWSTLKIFNSKKEAENFIDIIKLY